MIIIKYKAVFGLDPEPRTKEMESQIKKRKFPRLTRDPELKRQTLTLNPESQ